MATLLIDTCLDVRNIPIDYTDIVVREPEVGKIITASVEIPVNLLYTVSDASNASGLLNIKLYNAFNDGTTPPASAANVEANIESVIVNNSFLIGLANKLQECLTNKLYCEQYNLLQYLPEIDNHRPAEGFGRAVVRILQHLFMKHILSTADTNTVNNALNNVIQNDSSTVSNLLLNNEAGIRTYIEGSSIGANSNNYPNHLSEFSSVSGADASGVDASGSGANIVSRLLASLKSATADTTTFGDTNTAVLSISKLKNAIAYFLYQGLPNKLHDRVSSNVNDVSGNIYPIMFSADDILYFTIDLTSATLTDPSGDGVDVNDNEIQGSKLPDSDKLSDLTDAVVNEQMIGLGASRIYLKLIVGPAS